MSLAFENEIEIIEVMENYLMSSRPAKEIRDQIDINYKIENQSIIVFEIRPALNNPDKKIECNIAKAIFIKKENVWKIFWFMSDMKWHGYKPESKVKNLKEFVKTIQEDKQRHFWG